MSRTVVLGRLVAPSTSRHLTRRSSMLLGDRHLNGGLLNKAYWGQGLASGNVPGVSVYLTSSGCLRPRSVSGATTSPTVGSAIGCLVAAGSSMASSAGSPPRTSQDAERMVFARLMEKDRRRAPPARDGEEVHRGENSGDMLPRREQSLQHSLTDLDADETRRGKKGSMTFLGHVEKTAEERDRINSWTPIVKLVEDRRLRVALVGPMNVGKSSVFNLLTNAVATRPRSASSQIARDFEGITRDSNEAIGVLDGMHFTVMDTPGAVGGLPLEETLHSLESCDMVFLVTAADQMVSEELRRLAEFVCQRLRLPALLLINKIDMCDDDEMVSLVVQHHERHLPMLGKPLPISARGTHVNTQDEMWQNVAMAMRPIFHVSAAQQVRADWALEEAAEAGDETALEAIRDRNSSLEHEVKDVRVAFIGRPNSGKSTLVNRLLGFQRHRTHDDQLTTRDAIETKCRYQGRQLVLIDTAGLKRGMAGRNTDDDAFLQQLHNATIKAIKFAHVCVVCFDATEGHPASTDIALAHTCISEGRPVLFVATKWDAVLDQAATAEAIDFKVKRQVNEVKSAHCVVSSAFAGTNLTLMLDEALQLYDDWNKHLRAGDITRFWRKLEKGMIVPHHVARVHRIIQSHARPPTFLVKLQTRDPENLLPSLHLKMLKAAIAEEFGFAGVPIRVLQELKDSHPDFI